MVSAFINMALDDTVETAAIKVNGTLLIKQFKLFLSRQQQYSSLYIMALDYGRKKITGIIFVDAEITSTSI